MLQISVYTEVNGYYTYTSYLFNFRQIAQKDLLKKLCNINRVSNCRISKQILLAIEIIQRTPDLNANILF